MKLQTLLISLVLGISLILSGPAAAERGRGRKHNPEKMVQRLTQKLDLSEEQASQLRGIFESHRSELQTLREQMKSTFTEEQRNAMREMRKNRKQGGERPSKEERRARMQELGISQGQMQQMKSYRQQMKTIRSTMKTEISAVLTPDQQAKFEEMRKNRKGKRGQRGQRGQRGGGDGGFRGGPVE